MKSQALVLLLILFLFTSCGSQIWVKRIFKVKNESWNRPLLVTIYRDSIQIFQQTAMNQPHRKNSFEISPFLPLKTKTIKVTIRDTTAWSLEKKILFDKRKDVINITFLFEKVDSTHYTIQKAIKEGKEVNPDGAVLKEEELRIEVSKEVRKIRSKGHPFIHKCANE